MILGLLAFVVSTVLLAFTPGPDIVYVMTRSVAQGRLAGFVAALGMATGCLFHTALAAAGVSVIVKHSPIAFGVIKFLGAGYLCWLAVGAFRASGEFKSGGEIAPQKLPRIYGQSILMNVLNPKVMLFFLSYLVGFTRSAYPFPLWAQLTFLGFVFAMETVFCFGAAALLAGTFTRRLRKDSCWGRRLNVMAGVMFVGLAAMVVMQRGT